MNHVGRPRWWRARLARWFLLLGCRHPDDIICGHRQWLYDSWLRGYTRGLEAGTSHAEAEQRGQPPYDDHPCLRCGRLDCNAVPA